MTICSRDKGELESVRPNGDHVFTCMACLGTICEKEVMAKGEYRKWWAERTKPFHGTRGGDAL